MNKIIEIGTGDGEKDKAKAPETGKEEVNKVE